jgi:hypothetical protein
MNMTHYMELLADRQPWNLLFFMAVPVILAETVAITELFLLYHRATTGRLVAINRAASIAGGFYFIGVVAYLLPNAVVPITTGGLWRGPADVIAVGAYLLGVVPLVTMALLDLRWIGAGWTQQRRMWWHAACVAVFHVAMIFGMLDPMLLHDGGMAMDHSRH